MATASSIKAALRAEEASRFGKWATLRRGRPADPGSPDGFRHVETQADVEALRNTMALGRGSGCGNYPLSMSDCEVVGINGDCGGGCPVLRAGRCPSQAEMAAELEKEAPA